MPELGERLRQAADATAAPDDAVRAGNRGSSEPADMALISSGDELESLNAVLPGYEILERIHHGGQGVVYRAIQKSTRRTVAIKVLLNGVFASDHERLRFLREVELASRLSHPNIVTLFDSGVACGRHYCAMEFVEGLQIHDYITRNGCPLRERVGLMMEVCRAVHHAHQHGIIHRDLKPSNILIDADGVSHVVDFGLAKDVSESGRAADTLTVSMTGAVLGTLPFLSPEQAGSEEGAGDVRSDVYALGVVLFKTLTDTFPYSLTGRQDQVRDTIINATPQSLHRALATEGGRGGVDAREITDDLEAVVRTALEKDKSRRYQSTEALAADLEVFLRGAAVTAKASNRLYLLVKTARRYRWALALAAAVFIAIGATAAQFLSLSREKEAAQATGVARAEAERRANLKLFEIIQTNISEARVLRELMTTEPGDRWTDDVRRVFQPVDVPVDLLRELVTGMPEELLESMRDPDRNGRAQGEQWLMEVSDTLDDLSERLASTSFRTPVDTKQSFAFLSGYGPFYEMRLAAGAFVGRAYLRHWAGDAAGAVDDLAAASRLGADLGDVPAGYGGQFGLMCRGSVLVFLNDALADSFRTGADVSDYVQRVVATPDVPVSKTTPAFGALRMTQLINEAIVFDPATRELHLDLDVLDSASQEYFQNMDALTDENRRYARQLSPEDVHTFLDWAFKSFSDWQTLTFTELTAAVEAFDVEVERERKTNPATLLLPYLGAEVRVFIRAERRALRLVAWLIQYRERYGVWPERLEQAVSRSFESDLVDPVNGSPYVYDIVDGMPRLRSERLEDAVVTHIRRSWRGSFAQLSEDDNRLTYFPCPRAR